MLDPDAARALAQLYYARSNVQRAEEIAPDGGRLESVAENTRRRVEESIEHIEKEVQEDA